MYTISKHLLTFIMRGRGGPLVITSCGPVGFIEKWPPTWSRAVCSRVWSGWDEGQHLQIWGHGSQPEKGGFFPSGWEWDTASSRGVGVYQDHVHEWGLSGIIDRRIGEASAVMRTLYRSVVVKRELPIYSSIYVPTCTYVHKLWVMTQRMRLRIHAA